MKLTRIPIAKALLAVLPALLIALILQPAVALAQAITITYKTDGHGYFNQAQTETTASEETATAGSPANIPTPYAADNYEFVNWTVACDDFYGPDGNPTSETQFTTDELAKCAFLQDATITANFKSTKTYTVTYSGGNLGYFNPDDTSVTTLTEEVVEGNSPTKVPTPLALNSDLYAFKCWQTDTAVTLTDGTKIERKTPITSAQLKQVKITSNITFTAYFNVKCIVTYLSDDMGYIPAGQETSEIVSRYNSPVDVPTPVPNDTTKYAFGYWTADTRVTLTDGTSIAKGKAITDTQLRKINMWSDITVTAHYRDKTHAVTFAVDENSQFTDSSIPTEQSIDDAAKLINIPAVEPLMPSAYVFGYWTADVAVYLDDDSIIAAGKWITIAQLSRVVITDDVTFTAHCRDLQHTVTYVCSDKGHFKDQTSPVTEIVGDLESPTKIPTPVYETPGYRAISWTADVDVTLDDGTVYTAGTAIPVKLLSSVSVDQDITFTMPFTECDNWMYVTWTTDGKGTFEGSSESTPVIKEDYGDYEYLSAPTPVAHDPTKYKFAYWVNDVMMSEHLWDPGLQWVWSAGSHISALSLTNCQIVARSGRDVTLTATFEQIASDITYTSAGHGKVVDPKTGQPTATNWSERVAFNSTHTTHPTGSDTVADTGYVFDYWTANKTVSVGEDSATYGTTYEKGTPLTSEQIKKIKLGQVYMDDYDLIFTAHFTQLHTLEYKAGEHGSVSPSSEQVKDGESPKGPTLTPDAGYGFDYWTADIDVVILVEDESADDETTGNEITNETQAIMFADNLEEVDDTATKTIKAGDPISAEEFAQISVASGATFTAHFKRVPPFTVTYTTDGNGSVSAESEIIQEAFDSPVGVETTPHVGYEFDYWTASIDVQIPGTDGGDPITIAKGEEITTEQLKQVMVVDDITFKANFKKKAVTPDSGGSDSSSDSANVKPADGASAKVMPRTGDTLPGVGVIALTAGALLVAGTTILKKRAN